MRSFRPALTVLALAAASALGLSGCAGGAADAPAPGDRIVVVASTDVYGQIVEQIGGDRVDVTSIVSSGSADPHSFEPSARDQLAVSKAQLVVENGGGYDAFIDDLIAASGSRAPVLTAVEFSHDWPGGAAHDDSDAHDDEDDHDEAEHEDADAGHHHEHVEGFNEHVWYDVHAMGELARGIAAQLEVLDPEGGAVFLDNAAAFVDEIDALEARIAEIEAAHAGAQVFLTEPVPGPLVAAARLDDLTPSAFSEAVEEGQDVPPATLLEALRLIDGGEVRVVITNTQTGGAETTQIVEEAERRGIPVISFSETLPAGQTYLSWMQANIDALDEALTR